MSFALMAGVSGLQAHQRMLDVAGNNLANINTIGYKSSRIVFSELLAQVLKKASQPTATIGGINPQQIGSGVQIAGINPDMAQGNLINTNSPLDLAIEGEGYFVLSDGSQDLYTRAGAFAVDAKSNLVDPATGYLVQRTGPEGVSDNFQTAGENRIKIPYGVGISANATSEITVAGNLSANATLPDGVQKNILRSDIIYKESGSNAIGTTTIADLDSDFYTSGTWDSATITFSGWKPDGTAFGDSPITDLSMDVTAATTFTNILDHLNKTNEVQTITLTDATGGSFTVDFQATGSPVTIDWNDSADDVKTELVKLSSIGANDVIVTGGDLPGTPIVIEFVGALAATDVADLVINDALLTGGAGVDAAVEETIKGSATTGVLGSGATASLDNGRLVITDDTAGYSKTDIKMVFANGTGTADVTMPGYFEITTVGGDEVKSFNIVVYDSQGGSHVLSGAFVRNPDPAKINLWDLVLTSISGTGSGKVAGIDISGLSDRRIRDIKFNGADGAFGGLDTGTGDTAQFRVTFGHRPDAQVITVDMGTQGQFNGLTQFARTSTAVAKEQDGYATGELASVSISNDGYVIGTFTNGVKKNIAALQIALFKNPSGLESIGSGYFAPSVNSGDATPTYAMTSGAGTIRGGSLEKSNADVASLFVTMIEAQNGYHANARTIKVANDMLKELTNLIR